MSKQKKKRVGRGGVLAVREHLAPVDIYCYLKARFGEPNGYQTLLTRRDGSDNWIHWDYLLKSAADQDIYLCGMSRETHIMISGEKQDRRSNP